MMSFTFSNAEQMSEHVDDVSISCDEDSTVECQEINATLKWNFHIETEVRLNVFFIFRKHVHCSFFVSSVKFVFPVSKHRFHYFGTTVTKIVKFAQNWTHTISIKEAKLFV